MAERGSYGTTNDRGASGDGAAAPGSSGMRRVVALRPTVRRSSDPVPAWAEAGGPTGQWAPSDVPAREEPVSPFGGGLPFEPDPEAAAFLNAPRRPLAFYVAPFGTPPFGNPPPRPALGAPSGVASSPEWGPAYPAGA